MGQWRAGRLTDALCNHPLVVVSPHLTRIIKSCGAVFFFRDHWKERPGRSRTLEVTFAFDLHQSQSIGSCIACAVAKHIKNNSTHINMPTYTLAAKFASELLATTLAMFVGTSAVANELLPTTKGHGMGYFATGLSFVIAFFFSGACFGGISAVLNPAVFLYLAIRGELQYGWVEFFTGSAANILGGFFGGCLTYIFFAEYFKTVPLPQDNDPVSRLLHGPPDALSNDAGRFASAFGDASRPNDDEGFRDEVVQFGENIVGTSFRGMNGSLRNLDDAAAADGEQNGPQVDDTMPSDNQDLREEALRSEMERERLMRASSSAYNSSSFYVLPPMEAIPEGSSTTGTTSPEGSGNLSGASSLNSSRSSRMDWNEAVQKTAPDPRSADGFKYDAKLADEEAGIREKQKEGLRSRHKTPSDSSGKKKHVKFHVPRMSISKKKRIESEIRDAAFEAAIRADQAAKLSVFATRPAKYNRINNFVQEMMGTVVLIVGIQTLLLRQKLDPSLKDITSPYLESFFTAFFVTACVMGLGGTTGFAVNPGRDLGPRIAHFILPIPGKGESEWHYGWVPVAGPFVGACLAAPIMIALEIMYKSGI